MRLSAKTLEKLVELIMGVSSGNPIYRSANALLAFFSQTIANGPLENGEARFIYAQRSLKKCCEENPSDVYEIITDAFRIEHFMQNQERDAAIQHRQTFVDQLQPILKKDGFMLVTNDETDKIELSPLHGSLVATKSIDRLSHPFIQEQIKEAEGRIMREDYDGAITTARSLVEAVQEELIRRAGKEIVSYGGDVNKLYKQTKSILNLDPAQAGINDTLKQMLSGLISLVNSIAAIRNAFGDGHARQYRPSHHHARLTVNAALTFCEFLIDSFEYQQTRGE